MLIFPSEETNVDVSMLIYYVHAFFVCLLVL